MRRFEYLYLIYNVFYYGGNIDYDNTTPGLFLYIKNFKSHRDERVFNGKHVQLYLRLYVNEFFASVMLLRIFPRIVICTFKEGACTHLHF